MRRSFLLAAALTIPISGAFIGLTSGVASAGVKIICTNMSGSVGSGTITISGCTGGNTGGRSNALSISLLANGGTVPWHSGSTTHFSKPVLATAKATHCPGYVKPPKGGPTPNEPSLEKFSGQVTADNGDGIKVPGKYKGEVCISQSGNFSAPKALKVS